MKYSAIYTTLIFIIIAISSCCNADRRDICACRDSFFDIAIDGFKDDELNAFYLYKYDSTSWQLVDSSKIEINLQSIRYGLVNGTFNLFLSNAKGYNFILRNSKAGTADTISSINYYLTKYGRDCGYCGLKVYYKTCEEAVNIKYKINNEQFGSTYVSNLYPVIKKK